MVGRRTGFATTLVLRESSSENWHRLVDNTESGGQNRRIRVVDGDRAVSQWTTFASIAY